MWCFVPLRQPINPLIRKFSAIIKATLGSRDTLSLVTRQLAIYAFIVALISPFLIWALLGSMARRNPLLLAKVYPFVKILAWGMWVPAVLCIFFGIIGSSRTFASVGCIIFAFYSGINLMLGWIRKRIKPNPPATTNGLQPTPKNF